MRGAPAAHQTDRNPDLRTDDASVEHIPLAINAGATTGVLVLFSLTADANPLSGEECAALAPELATATATHLGLHNGAGSGSPIASTTIIKRIPAHPGRGPRYAMKLEIKGVLPPIVYAHSAVGSPAHAQMSAEGLPLRDAAGPIRLSLEQPPLVPILLRLGVMLRKVDVLRVARKALSGLPWFAPDTDLLVFRLGPQGLVEVSEDLSHDDWLVLCRCKAPRPPTSLPEKRETMSFDYSHITAAGPVTTEVKVQLSIFRIEAWLARFKGQLTSLQLRPPCYYSLLLSVHLRVIVSSNKENVNCG